MYMVDKTKWEDGPWNSEIDFDQWNTPEGFHAILIRMKSMGNINGYIGVPPGHKWHGKGYNTLIQPTEMQLRQKVDPEHRNVLGLFLLMLCDVNPGEPIPMSTMVRVHGGITFASYFKSENGGRKDWWYFGFDTAHSNDLIPGMMQYSWICGIYRDADYVRGQIEFLSRQIAILQKPYISPQASRNQREGWYAGKGKRTRNYTQRL